MIDLDQMDEQLARAVTGTPTRPAEPGPRPEAPPPVPAPARAPAPPRRRHRPAGAAVSGPAAAAQVRGVRELLELGLLEEADARIAGATDRRDALTWVTMRALLDGRQDASRAGIGDLRALARSGDDGEAEGRYWLQRFWAAFLWAGDDERYDVLEHCRNRAYRFDDLPWWGNLTLLLATMGKADEAGRAFDATSALLGPVARDGLWLDVVTNLIEGAALMGDADRMAVAHRALTWPEGRMVVVGPAVVCKGSVERYRGLALAVLGRQAEAAGCFRSAASAHRAMGAAPLLARTVEQSRGALVAA